MDDAPSLIYVDAFAPALLSSIRKFMDDRSWLLYLALVYEVLAAGSNREEYAARLICFLPIHPDIAVFHNTLSDLIHSATLEEAVPLAYTRLPTAAITENVLDDVKMALEKLKEVYVIPVRERGAKTDGSDDDAMDVTYEAMDYIAPEGKRAISSTQPSCDSFHQAHENVDPNISDWNTERHSEDNEWESIPNSEELSSALELEDMEPSVKQARSEALEYTESLNLFRAKDQPDLVDLMELLTTMNLNDLTACSKAARPTQQV